MYTKENGIILQLKMASYKTHKIADRCLRYFNCNIFSNFSHLNELLFMCPPSDYHLQIHSIYNMTTSHDYKLYINALVTFHEILNGINVINCTHSDIKIINHLSNYAINNQIPNDIPMYIVKSFSKWVENKTKVVIGIKHFDVNEKYNIELKHNLLSFDKIKH